MAFQDKETKRRWIEEKTAFIATEQLYLTVGKNFITRSAEAKRIGPDKEPDFYALDAEGIPFGLHEREMPIDDNACAFYSLGLQGHEGNSVRQAGVNLLLAHAGDEAIRQLMAFEIADKTKNAELNRWQEARGQHNLFANTRDRLMMEVNRLSRLRGTNMTAIQLLESDPMERDPELIRLQQLIEAHDMAKAFIREWACT